jgi:hypothetical protein
MTTRKATPSLLYPNTRSSDWVRVLSSFIDEGLAALCMRQWQQVPVIVVQPGASNSARRRAR